jgi:hypothetical protein
MANSPTNHGAHLPEPSHPFARWCAGAAISLWALGVQSFSDPWNKLLAILSPGFGYIIGHALDVMISRVSEYNSKRDEARSLLENKAKIDNLRKEREDAIQLGANQDIIEEIDLVILSLQRSILDRLTPRPTIQRKKP